jgi:hypothetical protein
LVHFKECRRWLVLSLLLGVLLTLLPSCGDSTEGTKRREELPTGRIPRAPKKK